MRIVVWNCCQRSNAKLPLLEALRPDVAVVPESQSPTAASDPTRHVAQGPNAAKCLSVFSFGATTLNALETQLPWVLPVAVQGVDPFLLLAVWTVQRSGSPSYAKQVSIAIDTYEDELADGSAVLAGDFNCAGNTSDPKHHLRNVDRLRELGMHSAYHDLHGFEAGSEPVGTLYWRWKENAPFHCDLAFIPKAWTERLISVEVGTFDDWVAAGHSDHCPVTIELGK